MQRAFASAFFAACSAVGGFAGPPPCPAAGADAIATPAQPRDASTIASMASHPAGRARCALAGPVNVRLPVRTGRTKSFTIVPVVEPIRADGR
jgi:hypothetical protein